MGEALIKVDIKEVEPPTTKDSTKDTLTCFETVNNIPAKTSKNNKKAYKSNINRLHPQEGLFILLNDYHQYIIASVCLYRMQSCDNIEEVLSGKENPVFKYIKKDVEQYLGKNFKDRKYENMHKKFSDAYLLSTGDGGSYFRMYTLNYKKLLMDLAKNNLEISLLIKDELLTMTDLLNKMSDTDLKHVPSKHEEKRKAVHSKKHKRGCNTYQLISKVNKLWDKVKDSNLSPAVKQQLKKEKMNASTAFEACKASSYANPQEFIRISNEVIDDMNEFLKDTANSSKPKYNPVSTNEEQEEQEGKEEVNPQEVYDETDRNELISSIEMCVNTDLRNKLMDVRADFNNLVLEYNQKSNAELTKILNNTKKGQVVLDMEMCGAVLGERASKMDLFDAFDETEALLKAKVKDPKTLTRKDILSGMYSDGFEDLSTEEKFAKSTLKRRIA